MRISLSIAGILAVTILTACSGPTRTERLYPDRPQAGGINGILQTFVGKPYSSLNVYLGKPDLEIIGETVWGEQTWVYTVRDKGDIGFNIDTPKQSHRDTCRVVDATDRMKNIVSIYYEESIWERGSVDCPNIVNLNKLMYIANPALYEYDKKHGIVKSRYLAPN